jgi:hypothetical protein
LVQYVTFYQKVKRNDSICREKRYCWPRITFAEPRR